MAASNEIVRRNYRRRDRTSYNTKFIGVKRKTHPADEPSPNHNHNSRNQSPPRKKRKKYKFAKKGKIDKQLQWDFINFMHQHEELTVKDILEQKQFKNRIHIKLNTLEQYRTTHAVGTAKWQTLTTKVMNDRDSSSTYKMPSNPQQIHPVHKSLFPTIEKYIVDKRNARKNPPDGKPPRDTSLEWMEREIEKLLSNQELLDSLSLTDFEREHLSEFKGSRGFCRKLMVCHFNMID